MDAQPGPFAPAYATPSAGAEPAPAGLSPLVIEVRSHGRVFVRPITGTALIGRRDRPRNIYPDIDLSYDDAVSRRHASLTFRDGQYWICDLQSTNGTVLNKLELTPGRQFPLAPGDELFLGEVTRLRVMQAPVPQYTSDAPAPAPFGAPLSFPAAPASAPTPPATQDPDERQVLQLIDELMTD